MSRDDDRNVESRRIIDRVGAETEASMAKRVSDHMSGRDADEKDWAELWGTRIGRWLGLALLIYLVYWLINFVVSNG
ncbi:hypothetical protein [Aquamicrobium sp. LC103]|uniref:hypothetical protein n=1 Tax=Aquamicrobium sp. LC103 TaxID=1120658 RepID=UPI00063E97DA|nr:hypothetical protein [Aquamicrobium sp. LC103]TKT82945.1 hypothetical protein XW59_002990 [Aquamicrobium sp. LC103]